jgi:hypothetical protein
MSTPKSQVTPLTIHTLVPLLPPRATRVVVRVPADCVGRVDSTFDRAGAAAAWPWATSEDHEVCAGPQGREAQDGHKCQSRPDAREHELRNQRSRDRRSRYR